MKADGVAEGKQELIDAGYKSPEEVEYIAAQAERAGRNDVLQSMRPGWNISGDNLSGSVWIDYNGNAWYQTSI